jgi:hypothetical protein
VYASASEEREFFAACFAWTYCRRRLTMPISRTLIERIRSPVAEKKIGRDGRLEEAGYVVDTWSSI